MEKHRFYNACMSLMNIDMHELVDAGIIAAGNIDNGGSSWKRFNDEPLVFLAKLDDRKRDALWRVLESRQRAKDDRPRILDALAVAKRFIEGFEGDPLQEGVDAMLAEINAALGGMAAPRISSRLDRALELLGASLSAWEDEEDSVQEEHADLIAELKAFMDGAPADEWPGSPDPADPDNFWIDDATGERVNAHTGERRAL